MSTVAGVWAEWGEWSECDPTSSNCKKFRFRNCNAPSADACQGDPTQMAQCPSESPNQPTTCQNMTNPGDLLGVR